MRPIVWIVAVGVGVSICAGPSAWAAHSSHSLRSPRSPLSKTVGPLQRLKNSQAEEYRLHGLAAQKSGAWGEALEWFQKAAVLNSADPRYQNDIGIAYEGLGEWIKAEQYYLRAIQMDASYERPYTNLAVMYDRRGDRDKAAFYWQKRAELGDLKDPWTRRAMEEVQQRLDPSVWSPAVAHRIQQSAPIRVKDTLKSQDKVAKKPSKAKKEKKKKAQAAPPHDAAPATARDIASVEVEEIATQRAGLTGGAPIHAAMLRPIARIRYEDTPLVEVLKDLSQASEVRILVDERILQKEDRVTASSGPLTLQEALDKTLTPAGYRYYWDRDQIKVTLRDE